MPDLLASTALLPLTPAIPSRAPVAAPAVADFMAMLGGLALPPGATPPGGKGQAIAGAGKDLPVDGDVAGDEDEGDPVIAWLPAGLVPVPVEPVALPDAVSAAALAAVPDGVSVAPAGEACATLPEGAPVQMDAALLVETAPVALAEAAPVDLPPVAIEPEMKAEAPVRERLPRPVPAPVSTPQPVAPNAPATQTAGQVFAAAISASFDSPAAARMADPVAVQAQAGAAEQLRTTVQAMAGADQAPLDLSRDDWAGKMADRIAALRDAAEATDTRIRLAPENLGNVDVSIRRDGDRLHIHFAAENPAARQLIAEAAPRLAELAEARGVKLGQTSVDGGTGGQSQGQSSQPQPSQPARPASAAARATQTDRDDRVA